MESARGDLRKNWVGGEAKQAVDDKRIVLE